MFRRINFKKRMLRWYKVDFLRIIYHYFEFILNDSLIYIFRWHNIKEEEICDPMEKIWVKKELYF